MLARLILLLSLLLAACSSPSSGTLLIGDDDDSVGDDDDSVGDDDDSVGDDDDSVGDDDDSVPTNPWAGEWFGGLEISRQGGEGGFVICEGDAFFFISDDGALEGEGSCPFGRGGTQTDFTFWGFITDEDQLRKGGVSYAVGDWFEDESETDGGIVQSKEGTALYMEWQIQLPGGPGGGEAADGLAWAIRK